MAVVTKEQQSAKNKQRVEKRKTDRANGIKPIKDVRKGRKQIRKGRKQQSYQERVRRRRLKDELIQAAAMNSSFSPGTKYIYPINNIAPNTNKFAPNTNKVSAKNMITVYDAILFPSSEQILPCVLTKEDEWVYDYDLQTPTDGNNNGWEYVCRQSTSTGPIKINTKNNGVIELEYLTDDQPVPLTIQTAVPYFIHNHTPVRKNKLDGGIMTAGGDRVEIRVGAVTEYRPRHRNNISSKEISEVNLNESGIDFRRIFMKSYLQKKYLEVLDQLVITGNYRYATDNEQSYFLHPSYAFSWNLTNIVHLDGNDFTRSHALFFPSKECPGGRTWLLFPEYKLAIECASPVLISWDGRVEKHCSCTNKGAGDIYSFFAGSWKNVQRHINIERAFELENRSEILEGHLVYVRCRKVDLKAKGLQMYDCGTADSYCTYLQAKIHTIIECDNNNKQVEVVFLASASRLGSIKFDMIDICNVNDVKDVEDM